MHIKTLLTRPAITTGPATPLRDAHALMRRHGIRHLPESLLPLEKGRHWLKSHRTEHCLPTVGPIMFQQGLSDISSANFFQKIRLLV